MCCGKATATKILRSIEYELVAKSLHKRCYPIFVMFIIMSRGRLRSLLVLSIFFLPSSTVSALTTTTTSSASSSKVDIATTTQTVIKTSIKNKSKSKWSRRTERKRQKTSKLLELIPPPSILIKNDYVKNVNNGKNWLDINNNNNNVPILDNAPEIDFSMLDPNLDPQQGGKLQPGSLRSKRKRCAIETFVHISKRILSLVNNNNNDNNKNNKPAFILDAGSGAGNLSIPLAGILNEQQQQQKQKQKQDTPSTTTTTTKPNKNLNNIGVIALDVNPIALQRLNNRNNRNSNPNNINNIKTICTDLAEIDTSSDYLNLNLNNKDNKKYNDNDNENNNNIQLVVSLHACGAATDMAISLATSNRIPFCMSPCCTAKAIKGRRSSSSSKITTTTTMKLPPPSPSSSAYRSGAPQNITYPRSRWLQESLKQAATAMTLSESSSSTTTPTSSTSSSSTSDDYYEILAKVADVGIGPQTPTEQILHQQKSKLIIEWDRLMEVYENHNYSVSLFRMKQQQNNDNNNHNNYYYGKSELLIGIPNELLLSSTTSATNNNSNNIGIIDDIFLCDDDDVSVQ